MEDIAYSPKQFCKVAGFSLSRLYKSWQEGKGPPFFKLGKRTVIPVDSAKRWLQEQAEAARQRDPRAERSQTPAQATKRGTDRNAQSSPKKAPSRSEVVA